MRLIAIVLGEEDSKVRNNETMALLDYGFNTKKMTVLKKKNNVIKEIKFDKGNKDKIEVKPKYDVGILEDKNSNNNSYKYDVKINKISLPLKKGDTIGKISIIKKDKVVTSIDLISNQNIEKLNYWQLYKETIKNSILGIIN